jgi:S1-C subfamily serine protease
LVDLLLFALLIGAGVLGWQRGVVLSLAAGIVFLLAGLPFAAIAAATGIVAPAVGYLLGGLLGLVPVALNLERITEALETTTHREQWALADRSAGAVFNVFIACCIAWFLGALASIVPADTGAISAMRGSALLGALVEAVPPQGGLGVLVLRSGLVPGVNGPLVLAEAPDAASATTPGVLAARASVLQVRSTACRQLVTGTGWVAGPGIVVTNAHVVAGSKQSFLAGGPRYEGAPATVTAFDPINDIAVLALQSPEAQLPTPLRIVPRIRHGERAAVIGFPRGKEQLVTPARIDRVARYPVEPLGGGAATTANILAFRAAVSPGNSGGPVLAEDGSVLGLVVAKGIGQRVEAAYGVAAADLLPIIAQGAQRRPTSTGECLTEDDLTDEQSTAPPVTSGGADAVR